MFKNRFVEYLWKRDKKTRIRIFGTFFLSLSFAFIGFRGIAALTFAAFMGFIILESLRIESYYYNELLKRNGLDTEKIDDMEEIYKLAEEK